MKRFAVNRTTVWLNHRQIAEGGLISVHRGKGTFVGKGRID